MAIDEKYMAGEFYTLLTNNETGKVAMMAATQKKRQLDTILAHFQDQRFEVKTLTRDLSPTYDWVGRINFMAATHVADKFHVLRQLFDSLEAVRIYYRQQLLAEKRKQQEQIHAQANQNQSPKTVGNQDKRLENGETSLELLARSIYLLYKKKDNWSVNQRERAEVLFKHYPQIQKAYELSMSFRKWYSKDYISTKKDKQSVLANRHTRQNQLNDWYNQVELAKVPEMLNFKALVQRNQGIILNYFINGDTNAKAEALNGTIKKIITRNVNTRNIDFAHFRLKNFLS